MAIFILMAFVGGVCVSLSRALNGRLSLATSPLAESLWNHVVGLAVLAAAATALAGGIGGPLALALDRAPATAWIGGPLGVIFGASGSWLISRIGAANTALMVIAGQMVSGVALDLLRGLPVDLPASGAGVALIVAGTWIAQSRRG
jgi:transporter family-2 protein